MSYIPVHYGNAIKYICSYDKHYFIKDLLEAEEVLAGGKSDTAYVDAAGNVRFFNRAEVWSLPEIALALKAYEISCDTGFWFYPILDDTGVCRLLVSKKFGKGQCILIDVARMSSIVVKDSAIVARLYDMLQATGYMWFQLTDIFFAICSHENKIGEFLPAVIVNRGDEDEYYALSPLFTRWHENVPYLNEEDLDNYYSVATGDAEYEDVYKRDGLIYRTFPSYWKPMSAKYMLTLIKMLRKLRSTPSNYLAIVDANTGDDYMYISTDLRHMVKASTFEHVIIKNVYLMQKLKDIYTSGSLSYYELCEIWRLAIGGGM